MSDPFSKNPSEPADSQGSGYSSSYAPSGSEVSGYQQAAAPQSYQQPAYQQPAYQQAYPQPGYAGYPGYAYAPPAQAPSNGLGVAGFVTGLLGLILCWVPFLGIVLGILGVILGGIGISSGRKKNAGIGLAVAGLVCGIVSLIPAIIIVVAVASV